MDTLNRTEKYFLYESTTSMITLLKSQLASFEGTNPPSPTELKTTTSSFHTDPIFSPGDLDNIDPAHHTPLSKGIKRYQWGGN